MKIKRRKRARNSMSITPLVDVVFLLLLFFALTLHFSPEEAISVELPTSSSAKQQSETEIILTVTPEGVIRWFTYRGEIYRPAQDSVVRYGHKLVRLNGKDVPSQSLETELASLRKIDEKQAVQVRADQEVEVGKLVAIIDAIRNAGFQYFDLMTQQVNRK